MISGDMDRKDNLECCIDYVKKSETPRCATAIV